MKATGLIETWTRPDVERAEGRDRAAIHAQMCDLAAWFVKNVAYSSSGSRFAVDHHDALASRAFDEILADLSGKRYGATCAGLSLFMANMARRHGYEAVEINFGDNRAESHVLVLVTVGAGERVFYDPTFGCFAGDADGRPLPVRTVIDLLRQRRSDELRWVEIGPCERTYLFGREERPEVPLISPVQELDQFRRVAMVNVKFHAAATWNGIWQWARQRQPEMRTVFDCLRFPLSTSGEAEAEAIADELRNIG